MTAATPARCSAGRFAARAIRPGLRDVETRPARALALVGHAEIGPDVEKVVLKSAPARSERVISRRMQPRDADDRIDLVDSPVGGDARSYLGRRSPLPSAVLPSSPVRV